MQVQTLLRVRETLRLIHRTLMTFVTVVLAGGAVAAWWYATPGNGLLLVAGILGLLALMAGLSIFRREIDEAEAETIRQMVDLARAAGPSDKAAVIQQLMRGQPAKVSVSYADPEVHRVDAATLEDAKRMAAEGAPLDDICRAVDREFDGRNPLHKDAFRRIVQTMVEQG